MYKIAIGNVISVPVKFTLREGVVDKLFTFTLVALRKTQEEIEEKPELSVKDFLLDNVTDCQGQRLVLLENNEPAPFTREAFDLMLRQPRVLSVVWNAYQMQAGSKEKN